MWGPLQVSWGAFLARTGSCPEAVVLAGRGEAACVEASGRAAPAGSQQEGRAGVRLKALGPAVARAALLVSIGLTPAAHS